MRREDGLSLLLRIVVRAKGRRFVVWSRSVIFAQLRKVSCRTQMFEVHASTAWLVRGTLLSTVRVQCLLLRLCSQFDCCCVTSNAHIEFLTKSWEL